MNPTTFEEVYTVFLNKVHDYYLKNKLVDDFDLAKDILHGYMASAINKFTYSKKDLYDRDETLERFNCNLNPMEKEILAMWMIVEHLSPKILRDEYLAHNLGSKDYNEFSPNNQLKQLQDLSNLMTHQANTLMLEYYYK